MFLKYFFHKNSFINGAQGRARSVLHNLITLLAGPAGEVRAVLMHLLPATSNVLITIART